MEAPKVPPDVRSDRTGKPFLVLAYSLRQCLVCEQIFSRQSAPQHAFQICYPKLRCASESSCQVGPHASRAFIGS